MGSFYRAGGTLGAGRLLWTLLAVDTLGGGSLCMGWGTLNGAKELKG